jgi:hypothetical protein
VGRAVLTSPGPRSGARARLGPRQAASLAELAPDP